MKRRIAAFLIAAAIMVVFGSATQSVFIQQAWSAAAGLAEETAPVAIPLADRVSWAIHDLQGLFVQYGSTTSIALLIAFLVAGALTRLTGNRTIVFGIAGAAAICTLFTALKTLLGTVGIFGARGAAGLVAQMVVGLVAGLVFAHLTAPSDSQHQGRSA